MTKVANIVSYKFLPAQSGGQKYIAQFLHHLGEKTKVYALGTANNKFDNNLSYELKPLLSKNPYSYFDIVGFIRIYQLLKKNKIGILIIEHPYIGWMGILLKKMLALKLIIHTHNIEYLRFRSLHKSWWKLLKIYETWILKKADHVFCITHEDQQWMVQKMKIDEGKTSIVPYGIQQSSLPSDKEEKKKIVCSKHGLDDSKPLIFFNGVLSYHPNLEAVEHILEDIIPRLNNADFQYNMIIAGKGLPDIYRERIGQMNYVIYTGFVDDIDSYTGAADIFINPILSGGGVKTKLIEALAMGCYCISTKTGAIGVESELCGDYLKTIEDNNWDKFTEEILSASKKSMGVNEQFYRRYSWDNITDELLKLLLSIKN